MLFDAMATILADTAISLVPGARAAPCPNGTVSVNLTSSGDMKGLIDAMDCSGAGVYDVTLHGRLQIGEILKVSQRKDVTVTGYVGTATGSGSDTTSALGSTSDSYAVLDAGNTNGIFLVSDGSTLTITNLILEGGYSEENGAAIAVTSSSTLKVFDCDFTNNTASMFGGAISAKDHSNIYIDGHTYFGDNWAYYGGAISARHSKVYINDSTTFRRNLADSGGAICSNNSDIHINGNTECDRSFPHGYDAEDAYLSETDINRKTLFVHNSARNGGGIHAVGGSILCCAGAGGTVFLENEALDDGGALSLTSPTKVNVASVIFISNTANRGGALYTMSTKFRVEAVYQSCVFSNNYATDGGGTYFYGDPAISLVNASIFFDNHAGTSGGAVYVAGSLKLFGSEFYDNRAGRDGVAISSGCAPSLVEFEDVTFQDNGMLCPLGQYEPVELDSDAAAFAKVCEGCSSDERTVPAGVLDTQWQLPSCEELPTGTVAVTDGTTTLTLSLAEGYYRDSATSDEILECYRHEACVGGDVVEKYCADGYEGAYCSVCSIGYSSGVAHSCRKCSGYENSSAAGITMAVIIAVCLAAAEGLRRLGNVVEHEERQRLDAPQDFVKRSCSRIQNLILKALPRTAIKIVVVVWQIISQFAAVAEDVYPKQYETFVSRLSFFNFDLSLITSSFCLLSTNFYGRLLLATILPLLVLAILALAYHAAKGKYPISSQQRLTVWSRHLSAGLVVVFFVYSSVSSTILQTFVCENIAGGWYLQADYSISCKSTTHIAYMVYAFGMCLVYPVGIPVSFCWWLVRNRKDLQTSDRETMVHLEPYSGIWGTYKPSQYYYEVVEYFRRFVISVSSVFLIPDSVNNIAVILTLTGGFMFLSESLSPFESNLDNMGLYRWGNGVVMASMFVALLNTANASDDESLSVFGWVLIIVNVAMIVAVVAEAVALVRAFRGELELDAK